MPTKLALAAAVQERGSLDGRLRRRGRHAPAPGPASSASKWPDTAKMIYTGMQLVLTGQAAPADAMAKAGAS